MAIPYEILRGGVRMEKFVHPHISPAVAPSNTLFVYSAPLRIPNGITLRKIIIAYFREFVSSFRCVEQLTSPCPEDHPVLQEDWTLVYNMFKCACNGSEGNCHGRDEGTWDRAVARLGVVRR